MLTYNMDVEERSTWLRATPGAAALAQPFYCTEAGNFYGRAHFATARTDKESYLLFYTLSGSGLIEQNDQRVELPAGSALLLNCRTPQSYCTASGQDHWHHYWAHLDGAGVANLAEVLQPQGRLSPVTVSRLEMQPLFESLAAEWEHGAAAQIEICLALHRMLALMARQLLAGDESRSNRTLIEQAAEYIRQHYAEPLSLDSLLAQTPVSKSWFLRLFRQYMGTTPYNFLLSTRITRAKELLVLTDFSVCEIAHQVGFGDESNFSTRFTAMVGQSPQQYRLTLGGQVERQQTLIGLHGDAGQIPHALGVADDHLRQPLRAQGSTDTVHAFGFQHTNAFFPIIQFSAGFIALLRYCWGLWPTMAVKRVEKLLSSPKPT